MDLPPVKRLINKEGQQQKALVFISETALLFPWDSHLSLRMRETCLPLCQAHARTCSAPLQLTLIQNISVVLEGMQLESKSSRTAGEQWHSSSASGEQGLTCPARPWEPFPSKEKRRELGSSPLFHFCSPRSPVLQQRTHKCKGKGGRGGVFSPHSEVEGVKQISLYWKGRN